MAQRLRLSRTGPIREGIEYQDLYAARLLIRWLAHPADYEWVRFEASEFGSLDDIAICDADLNLELTQVKHTTERPDRPEVTPEELTHKEGASKRSLFEKWFDSWITAHSLGIYRQIKAFLYTNRPASADLVETTSRTAGGALVLDPCRLAFGQPGVYEQMRQQAGDHAGQLEAFLSVLQLQCGQPDITALRELVFSEASSLNLSREACRDLEDGVWKWASTRTRLALSDIRRACGWNQPRPIDEEFPVPSDYVPLASELLSDLVGSCKQTEGGIRIVAGVPGSGKSVFLSKLHVVLKSNDIPCIRHHFFIPKHEIEASRRLRFETAANALLYQLERELPQETSPKNPTPQLLGEMVRSAAAKRGDRGKTLVLIVDGLDHVVRDESETELVELLDALLPASQGLWLIFGTRIIPRGRAQALLEKHAPRNAWFSMPRMSREECGTFLRANQEVLHFHDSQLRELSERFHRLTEGHPLHARYSVQRLQQMAASGPVSYLDVDRIEAFGGDIAEYYAGLWRSCNYIGKEVGALFAVAQFPLSYEGVSAILRGKCMPAEVLKGLDILKPLFRRRRAARFELFHPSFADFMHTTPEFTALRLPVLSALVKWLETDASDDLRWKWLLRKKYELGDSESLIAATTREWAIKAVREGRNSDEIIATLELAKAEAMANEDYGRALERGQLAIYMENSRRSEDQTWDGLEVLCRRVAGRVVEDDFDTEIQYHSAAYLAALAWDADRAGRRDDVERIVEELDERRLAASRADSQGSDREWWGRPSWSH